MIVKPQLEETQFALLMADGATGTILLKDGAIYLNGEESPYLIFDDMNSLNDYIKETQKINNTIEFCIYDRNYNLIEFITATKWT